MAQTSPSTETQAVRVTPPQAQTSPPISSILPLVSTAFTTSLSALSHAVWLFNIIFFSLLYPFLAIIPIPIYLLSPVIITSKVLLDLFVVLPYHAVVYVSQALYPLYAFLGVACLSGVLLALGRVKSSVWLGGDLGDSQSTGRSRSPSRVRLQKRPSASARGKRKVTVRRRIECCRHGA
ncbi:hypothetical protein BGY98DRAFT_916723 [Russula aff. rugulosa BPL654]|nr:hypothetical protein BGY98DRAFT_916723 [Russula aff. rugulosa BPL654]